MVNNLDRAVPCASRRYGAHGVRRPAAWLAVAALVAMGCPGSVVTEQPSANAGAGTGGNAATACTPATVAGTCGVSTACREFNCVMGGCNHVDAPKGKPCSDAAKPNAV